MAVAGGADAVAPVAHVRNRFQVSRLRGAVGLVRGIRELFHVAVPLRIPHALRNHQRVGGFRQRRGACLYHSFCREPWQGRFSWVQSVSPEDPPDQILCLIYRKLLRSLSG